MTRNYTLIQNKYEGCPTKLNAKKLKNGYRIHPKNQDEIQNTVEVSQMTINSKNFVEHIVKKKVSRKLEGYIQYIMSLVEDDETGGDLISFVLNDVTRFRMIVKNKYRKYLDDHYTEMLLKKIDLLEHELKVKAYYLNEQVQEYTETKGKRVK